MTANFCVEQITHKKMCLLMLIRGKLQYSEETLIKYVKLILKVPVHGHKELIKDNFVVIVVSGL